jgi:type I restriction enzyme S subunit
MGKPISTHLGLTDAYNKILLLKNLTEQIFQGISLSRYRDNKGSSERIVNVRDLKQLYVTAEDLSVEQLSVPNLDKHQLNTSDVVIPIRGMPLRASVVTDQVQGSLAGQNLAVLRPRREVINPMYLAVVMRSEWLARSLNKFYGSSTGTQLLKLSQLRDLEIPVPDLATQYKVAQLFLSTERTSQITLEKLEIRQRQTELILSRILEGQQ